LIQGDIVKFRFFGLLVFVILCGCSVLKFNGLKPVVPEDSSIWLNGKELVKIENENIEVVVNYSDALNGILSFDVSIANNSNEALLIIPEKFYCITTNRLDEKRTYNALNPEEMISSVTKQLERSYSSEKTNNQSQMIFTLFSIAESIKKKEYSGEELEQKKSEHKERYKELQDREEMLSDQISSLHDERIFLQNSTLRKTTLFPEQKLGGKVFFQVPRSSKSLELFIVIEDQDLHLKYECIK
jgi:cell division protein FtsB